MCALLAIAIVLGALAPIHAEPLPPPLTDRRVLTVALTAGEGWRLSAVSGLEVERGVVVLVIEDDVFNSGDREHAAPQIRLAVRDEARREIFHWTVLPDQARIRPGDWSPYKARVESPPEDAYSVEIRTLDQD